MSLKKSNLKNLLFDHYHPSIEPLPKLTWGKLKSSPLLEEVTDVYQQLGGQADRPGYFPGDWDIELEGNIAIQLDEQLHFNKYRSITLRSEIYRENPPFQLVKYQNYSRKRADECLKSGLAGKLWTNLEAEKQFGNAEAPGDLSGNGSPAWKLRAFADYLQDVSAKLLPIKLFRVSIYDEIMVAGKLIKLNEILTLPTEQTSELLLKSLARKIGEPTKRQDDPEKDEGSLPESPAT